MSITVISVENLSKSYRLGQIGTGTLTNDLKVWWAKKRGQPNPLLKIGQNDHGNRDGEELWALRDVSFTVQQGEVLGIIGRNGAGKSTLLKILSRVTAPTGGCVKVRGRIASLLEVGTGFHPELTGRENISLNGAILGMSKQEIARKFDEIVAFAEVEKFIDTPVKRYSSGMYVRLAFAVAAHLESEILLVDEVLAVGDAEFQKKCLGKMGDVASKEGRTVLFVSHLLGSIRTLCPVTLLLNQGNIFEMGITDSVVTDYLNMFSNKSIIESALVDCSLFDHSGTGEAKIVKAEMRNSKGENTTYLDMMEGFQVIFEIQNPMQISLNFGIEILDKNDYPLYHLLSEYDKVEIKGLLKDNGRNKIIVDIPNLNLFPDMYSINLWTGIHNTRVDKVEKCFTIQILKNNKITRELVTNRGRIFTNATWIVS